MKSTRFSCKLCGVNHDYIEKDYCPECEQSEQRILSGGGEAYSDFSIEDIEMIDQNCDTSFLIELDESDFDLLY